jgi:hypothetical protein
MTALPKSNSYTRVEGCSIRPFLCALAWERVPDRAGEGCLMQVQTPETIETKGPHPGFAHLLPCEGAREKAIILKLVVGGKNSRILWAMTVDRAAVGHEGR